MEARNGEVCQTSELYPSQKKSGGPEGEIRHERVFPPEKKKEELIRPEAVKVTISGSMKLAPREGGKRMPYGKKTLQFPTDEKSVQKGMSQANKGKKQTCLFTAAAQKETKSAWKGEIFNHGPKRF